MTFESDENQERYIDPAIDDSADRPTINPQIEDVPTTDGSSPASAVVSGVEDSIDAALHNMTLPDDDNEPTIIKRPEALPELERGEDLYVEDLPDSERNEIVFDQAFSVLERDVLAQPEEVHAESPVSAAAPVIRDILTAPRVSVTMPSPAFPSTNIDLDEDDAGPRAGVFRIPNHSLPNISLDGFPQPKSAQRPTAVRPAESISGDDRATLAPPPLAQELLNIHERKTVDLTAQVAIFWAFTRSTIYLDFEKAFDKYLIDVKKNPQLIKPDIEEYLARFQAIQGKE